MFFILSKISDWQKKMWKNFEVKLNYVKCLTLKPQAPVNSPYFFIKIVYVQLKNQQETNKCVWWQYEKKVENDWFMKQNKNPK